MDTERTGKAKITLTFASVLAVAVWRAIEADGETRDPIRLAEVDALLKSGDASLGIFVQRIGDEMHVSATMLPADLVSPFTGPPDETGKRAVPFIVHGPCIVSPEQIDALNVTYRENFN
jgi:hypothetical protein